MEDKMFDDDDIIDLTDLLEEGEPSKKGKATSEEAPGLRASASRPDSFDLGKEISMDYDVSVEEIDHGGEGLDMDVSLSSNEKVALAEEREGGEAPLVPDGALQGTGPRFDDGLSLDSGSVDLAAEIHDTEDDTYVIPEEETQGELSLSGQEVSGVMFEEEKSVETSRQAEDFSAFDRVLEQPARQEEMSEIDLSRGGAEAMAEKEPDRDAIPYPVSEEAVAELRQELPAMLEGIVRPLMAELVREMISATREQLPGIVEKVIREEIEKLKKLDS